MQTNKSNIALGLVLFLMFLRPFICQRCYPDGDIYYSLIFLSACAWYCLIRRPRVSWKSRLNYPLLFFVTAVVISTLFSLNIRVSLKEIYKFIPYLAAYYLMGRISPLQRREVLIVLVAAGFLLSLYAIYQFFWGFQKVLDYLGPAEVHAYAREFLSRKRVFATFLSPNMFAGYLIMLLPLGVGLFFDGLIKKKPLFCLSTGCSILLMFTALVLSKSIGAWLSLLVIFLVFSALLCVYFPIFRPKVILSAVFICIIIISILAGILIIRADSLLDFSDLQNPIAQRLYFWRSTVKIIKDFPFAGVGPGNFGSIYRNYKMPPAVKTQFAHNSYLQLWAETGILGIAAWLWLSIASLRLGLRKLTTLKSQGYLMVSLLAASSAFLIHNLIDFDFFLPEVALHWWVILGLIAFWPEAGS